VEVAISSSDHPAWQWLSKRIERIAGLDLKLLATQGADQLLQTLSGIPNVQLRVEWVDSAASVDRPRIAQWLEQHGQLVSHITVENKRFLWNEEPWELLAKLTSLRHLSLSVKASGDPSPLSALTGLSYLSLGCLDCNHFYQPFRFSSLQPLSTLQQLEVLRLWPTVCGATSLQGLAGLSNLKLIEIGLERESGWGESWLNFLRYHPAELRSLEGVSPGLTEITIRKAPRLVTLAGLEGCTSLQKLSLQDCPVSSLQPLVGLSSLTQLAVVGRCNCLTSLESLESTSLQSLSLKFCSSLTGLSGVEHLPALRSLKVVYCEQVTSLQPLAQLGEQLQELKVEGCLGVLERELELPHVQPTTDVLIGKECPLNYVVLADGEPRATQRWN
jgi:hypothetical protein